MTRPSSWKIGEGFAWADSICSRAIANTEGLSDASVDFVMGMADRFGRFGAETLVSKKQVEWLGDIERKLDGDEGDGR